MSRRERLHGRAVTPALVTLAAFALSVTGVLSAQERKPAADALRAAIAKLPRVPGSVEEEEREKEESGDLRRAAYASCIPPDAYLEVFERSGMKAALEDDGDGNPEAPVTGWTPLGPIGDYSSRNGRISGIQLVPTGPGLYRIYSGAASGGLWFTDLSSLGAWTSLGDNLPNPAVRAFHVDPSDPQKIVVGTGDIGRWKGGGVFYSTNGGASWSAPLLPITTPDAFGRIVPAPGLPQALLAASSGGLLFSTTGGSTWGLRRMGNCTDVRWHPTDSNRAWACFQGEGLFRSVNGGANWVQVFDADFPPANEWKRASLAICRDEPDVIACVVEYDGGDVRAVLRTEDGGGDWTDVTGPLFGWGNGQADHAQAIAIKPDDGDRMYVGAVEIARTENGGGSWFTGANGIPKGHADITQLHFDPLTGDDTLWITNDGGIYVHGLGTSSASSLNGNSNSGLNVSQIGRLDADRAMRAIGLQDNGIVRSLDYGQTWQYLQGGDGGQVEITDPETLRLWWGDGIYSSPSWQGFRKEGNGTTQAFGNPDSNSMSLFFDRYGGRMYTMGWSKIWSIAENASGGSAWSLDLDLGTSNIPTGAFGMSGSESDGRTLYIPHRDAPGPPPPDLKLTICRRGSGSWTVWHRVLPAPGARKVWTVTPSGQWPGECWAAIDGGLTTPKILHSTDYGASWTDLTANLAGVIVRRILPRPFDPLTLYAATDIGMFKSEDGGGNWQPFQDGLAMAPCFDLRFAVDPTHSASHRLVLATFGRGAWTRDIASAPIVYVDVQYANSVEDGTYEHPFNTIGEGVAAAPSGSIVAIRSSTYSAPITIAKNVRVVTWAGPTYVN